MQPEAFTPDVAALVPQFTAGGVITFVVKAVWATFVPGLFLASKLRLRTALRAERLAVAGLLGVIAVCLLEWILMAAIGSFAITTGCLLLIEAVSVSAVMFRLFAPLPESAKALRPGKPTCSAAEKLGYWLIAALIVYYLARTVPLFDFDGERLRLYGAAFTDKTTNMMSCAALQHGVPPDCLRFAGHKFPSHYFPHLYAAMFDGPTSRTETSYLSSFWYYVPALGIAINGLAILAFGRRLLKSYAAGVVALVVYGLTCVTPQLKPLDITPAAAMIALIALDRFARTGRKRWAALAVVLVGTMPCFETFHAILMLAELGLWGGVGFAKSFFKRLRGTNSGPTHPWRFLVIPALAGLTAFASLQLLYLGERPVAPPKLKVDNVFGDSYRATWESRAGDDDLLGRTIDVLDAWKRKPKKGEADVPPVDWYQQATAKLIYTVGVPIYVFCRFVHVASFGLVHLRRARKTRRLRPSEQLIACAALIGFTVPWIIDVGIQAGGQWWSSPNLYRPTEFGSWLLATLGCGVLVDSIADRRRWKQPTTWFLGLVAGYWLVTVGSEHFAPATQYLEVPRDQLRALAFMRQQIEYGDVVVHPWSDCVIRDSTRQDDAGRDAAAFVYKRHFTLGSNLAGRTMYYEGREDYTFSNGFIAPEEVYRRSKARKAFYTPSDGNAATIATVLETVGARVEYVVEDVVEDVQRHAPQSVRETWPIVFQSGDVVIRRRPE